MSATKRVILSETKAALNKGDAVVAYHPRHQPEPMLATVTERFASSIPTATYVKVQFANGVEATTHFTNVGPTPEVEWTNTEPTPAPDPTPAPKPANGKAKAAK